MRRTTYNDPGVVHSLTFSTEMRSPFFLNPRHCHEFVRFLEVARERHAFEVWAYVIMPDHVHLLVWPKVESCRIERFLQCVKMGSSRAILRAERQALGGIEDHTRLLPQRVWLRGSGYDKCLRKASEIWTRINYIHANPVRKGFVEKASSYLFSSASWYEGGEPGPFIPDGPRF